MPSECSGPRNLGAGGVARAVAARARGGRLTANRDGRLTASIHATWGRGWLTRGRRLTWGRGKDPAVQAVHISSFVPRLNGARGHTERNERTTAPPGGTWISPFL